MKVGEVPCLYRTRATDRVKREVWIAEGLIDWLGVVGWTGMQETHLVHIKDNNKDSYVYRVVLEADGEGWFVYSPTLNKKGGATWGRTKEEALGKINEVIGMILEELVEEGQAIPEDVMVSQKPLVAVTI